MDDVYLDTTIEELSRIENLSTRAKNICRYNNYRNLFQILDHYVSNGSFLDIRNCGLRTSMELVMISRKYLLLYPLQKDINNEPPDSELIPHPAEFSKKERLTQFHKTILTNYIYIKKGLLSNRFNNALKQCLRSDFSFDSFDRLTRSIPNRKIINIKGMGEKSNDELKYLINALNEYIDIITLYDETELLRELYVTYLQRFYELEDECLRLITSEYDFSRGIPVFKTIFYLSKFRKILGETERLLFFSDNYRYIDFTADHLFFELSECKVTRERIRQVNQFLPSKLHEIVYKIFKEDLKNNSLNTYSFNQQTDFILVDSNLLEQIRSAEKVSFAQQFVTFILFALYEDSHFLLGDVEWFYPLKFRRRYFEWKNFYLINRRFEKIFNFREFVLYLSKIIAEPKYTEQNQNIDFHFFLTQFFISNDYSEIDTIADMCMSIFNLEFPSLTFFADLNT
ncbi:MAG: hypothetical protein PHC31_05175 [Clostridia bacterium]|nr:hypothetical protein [Clostridia bacterium]